MNKDGSVLVPAKYDDAGNFSEGLARVELGDKYGFIDKTGKEVIPFKYDDVYSFSEGLALVERQGREYYIDKTGNESKTRQAAEALAALAKSDAAAASKAAESNSSGSSGGSYSSGSSSSSSSTARCWKRNGARMVQEKCSDCQGAGRRRTNFFPRPNQPDSYEPCTYCSGGYKMVPCSACR
ncbi:hypothetical protein FACS189454_07100 [Planctomycetales bacterium]|nr:hypothetical protein FACS189454_07100 [Planctomycetales bacterium]